MGEINRFDPVAVERARREEVLPAAVEAISKVHIAANDAIIYTTERIYQRSIAIENDAVYRITVDHSTDLVHSNARAIKGLADDATTMIRNRVRGL